LPAVVYIFFFSINKDHTIMIVDRDPDHSVMVEIYALMLEPNNSWTRVKGIVSTTARGGVLRCPPPQLRGSENLEFLLLDP
jgi:hypothetical protein